MQTLLPLVRQALEGMPALNRRSDCYITPHANWMPTGTRQPSIGIKDGGVLRREQSCGAVELTMTVDLVVMVHMAGEGETPICAESGVFALADQAMELLLTATALEGFQGLTIGPDRPTELYQAASGQFLIKLVRTMIYTIER